MKTLWERNNVGNGSSSCHLKKRQRIVRNRQRLRAPLHSQQLSTGFDAPGVWELIYCWIGHLCLEDSSVHQRSGAGTAYMSGCNTQPASVSFLELQSRRKPAGFSRVYQGKGSRDAEGISHPITRVHCRLTGIRWLSQATWGVTA